MDSGLIFDPIKDEMFFAEKGAGAFLNNSRLRVSNKKKLKDSLIVTGGPKFDSKNKDYIFDEYVKKIDIICLSETKLTNNTDIDFTGTYLNDYQCFTKEKTINSHPYGGRCTWNMYVNQE